MRKIMIVVEETGAEGGKGFNVYLAGDIERLEQGIKDDDDDKSPAEFWASKLFNIVGDILIKTGAAKDIYDRKNPV